ncbi:hypothetical protein [Xanthomonas sacchari]|uniref:hypothetical protein n=1 Tax=Xanthomonas sacchari TaxID=56458 RepID=UPI00225E63BC|nr:hypothetical protein [Xanthomonas sacchari]MCW0436160.1 hypothetical protein [Xanthomonas sacchari]
MHPNWPLIIALGLVVLKQTYKLYLHHVPDRVDYLKAAASLPLDISFLIVSLFIKAAADGFGDHQRLMGLLVVYIIFSVMSALLWRVSDDAIRVTLSGHFIWAFPLNLAMSSTALFLALIFIG